MAGEARKERVTPNRLHMNQPFDPTSGGPHAERVGGAIRARRTGLGWSLQKLADLIGCAKSYLSEVETGRRAAPSDEMLAQVEGVMMLVAGSLVERARWERGLKAGGPTVGRAIDKMQQENEAGRKLAELIREHAGQGKQSLDALYRSGKLHHLVGELPPPDGGRAGTKGGEVIGEGGNPSSSAPEPLPPGTHVVNIWKLKKNLAAEVPLINAVSAGYPKEFTDLGYPARVADEYVRCPDIDDPDAFAARVVGDSMMPDYREGDVIVFSPGKPVKSGSDCFVRLERDAETTFKRVYFEKSESGEELIRLQPINNEYSARVFPREDVAGLYVAVKAIRAI